MTFSSEAYRRSANEKFAKLLAESEARSGIDIKSQFAETAKYPMVLAVAIHLREVIKANVETTIECLAEMERRVAAVEANGVKYCGVWDKGARYGKGDIITHGGSAWIAQIESKGVIPGDGKFFKLMVKRGADGKDAR